MVDGDEDFGISVEFDQLTEETLFYTNCEKERGDDRNGKISRADSAVCLNSARFAPPAALQSFNGSRKVNARRTFHEMNVKRADAFHCEMQVQRKGTDSYLLTQQRLSIHIIDFIDIPLKRNMKRRIYTDRVEQPLYSMTQTGLEVNSDYFFPLESPYAKIQLSYLRTLVESLTKYYKKLLEICEFVEQIEERSQMMLPMLVAVIFEWAKEFIRDHSLKLDQIRSKRLVDPLQTLARLVPICEDIEVVHEMIGDEGNKQIWLWNDIEVSWNRVFLITQREAMVKKREVVQKLQEKWINALLLTMDHIFEVGRVPPDIGQFVLHNDTRIDAELLLCRNLDEVGSLLWDEKLIETILQAVKCRIRHGIIEFPGRTFTKKFMELLANLKYREKLLSFVEFRSIFVETCEILNHQFAQELLKELHENDRFLNLWNDLENVVVGSVSQQYASIVFRSDSNVTNFSDAFWIASRGRMHQENIMHFSWMANKSEFVCRLDHLLGSFIHPEVIEVMNQCMRFAHSAYRTRELLVTMANDKELLNKMTVSKSSVDITRSTKANDEANMNRALRKRLRFFVFTLEQIVSHFKDLFVDKVKYVFKCAREEMIAAKSMQAVEEAVNGGHKQLQALVQRSGVRKAVHEAMDLFKGMADEIRLRSVSNTLDLSYLQKCESNIRITLNRLLVYHKSWSNEKDSIFFHLSVRLGRLDLNE